MTVSDSGTADAMEFAMNKAREYADGAGTFGYGTCELFDKNGVLKLVQPFWNKITDVGDLYHAQCVIAGVSPANASAPTKITGIQVGTSSTAESKSSTGAAIVTFTAGQALDTSFPTAATISAGNGANATYKVTLAAGTATGTITEATLVTSTVGSAANAANTVARSVFTGIPKAAGDSLTITWNIKFLGP